MQRKCVTDQASTGCDRRGLAYYRARKDAGKDVPPSDRGVAAILSGLTDPSPMFPGCSHGTVADTGPSVERFA